MNTKARLITLKEIITSSSFSEKLIRSTVRQLGGIILARQQLNDISLHGADKGYTGFIYHCDTVAFFNRNKKDIMYLIKQDADDMGYDLSDMLLSFGCLKHEEKEDVLEFLYNTSERSNQKYIAIKNCLAWYTVERIAFVYSNID